LAGGINQSINSALKNAGPFCSILGQVGGSLASQAINTLTNNIFGGALGGGVGGGAPPSKLYPGGGGEPQSDYGGEAYTLNDVVFSIEPANQGPQAFGLSNAFFDPKTITSIPATEFLKTPFNVKNFTSSALKLDSMKGGVIAKSFAPSAPLAPSTLNFGAL
jgi:hypothetical protein